ncbi:hypothetical protein [Paenibacillus sp. 1001270B_150601_E10]|uniref:hypothetical protein n=1 Tax=Paenibacillus sp. 1001270B_150601_E10 TaxID=2787079 RepID=UPI00189F3212|nr:hypothetical protein [Paenibacillus sp. 1001270B_150601_E10]
MGNIRLNLKISTVLYGLSLALTVLIMLWTRGLFPSGHWLVSLLFLIAGETGIYFTALYYSMNKKKALKQLPSQSVFVTVSILYFIAVVGLVLVVSLLFRASTTHYVYSHLAVLLLAAIVLTLGYWFSKYAGQQEEQASSERRVLQRMDIKLAVLKQQLARGTAEEAALLAKEIGRLQEKVKYSDPVVSEELYNTDYLIMEKLQELENGVSMFLRTPAGCDSTEIRSLIGAIEDELELRNRSNIQIH